jgi:uncharacterized phage protein (TIGR02220 family)
MAAPIKQGLSYFSLDLDINDDSAVEFITAEHGLVGFALYIQLLIRVYKNGYFFEWGERQQSLFAKKHNVDNNGVSVDINYLKSFINDCFEENLFDKNLFEKYKILTSKSIQERFLLMTTRRKELSFFKEFVLCDLNADNCQINSRKIVIVNINNVNVSNNDVNEIIKGTKESKVNRKEEERKEKRNIIVQHLNQTCSKNYKPSTETTIKFITARLNDGFTVEDFIKVIDTKSSQWKGDSKDDKYLRPETLFGTKFESYLNEKPKEELKSNTAPSSSYAVLRAAEINQMKQLTQ